MSAKPPKRKPGQPPNGTRVISVCLTPDQIALAKQIGLRAKPDAERTASLGIRIALDEYAALVRVRQAVKRLG